MNTDPRYPFRENDPFGRVVLRYHGWLHDRKQADARAARARLRRCTDPLDAIGERGAHQLLRDVESAYADVDDAPAAEDRLLMLAPLLAWVETHDGENPLPVQLAQTREGSDRPLLSELRFQRLLTSTGPELFADMRRALRMLDNKKANTLWLAEAVCRWDDEQRSAELRRRWAYQYYSHMPASRQSA